MVLNRRGALLLITLVVAVIALSLIGILRGVSASSTSDTDNFNDSEEHSTLTTLIKSREREVVDLGPRGPTHGDLRLTNAPLYNESGKKRIGRLDLFCAITDPADESAEKAHIAECTATLTLPGGEISAQGVQAYPKLAELTPGGVDAITGGTGKYAGVRGEVQIEPRGNKVIQTFRFID
jgi:hypothetical protein